MGRSTFSERVGELIGRYGRVGCGLDVVRRAAYLFVGPVVVGSCASLFDCTTAVRASGSVAASSWDFDRWVGALRCVCIGLPWFSCFYLLWHTVGLAMGALLCLLW